LVMARLAYRIGFVGDSTFCCDRPVAAGQCPVRAEICL
jgi:hypothetical protein